MLLSNRGLAALVAGSLMASVAMAQTVAPRDPNMPDPKFVPPEKIAPQEPSATGSTGQSLSERLERTEGVITPPATGNDMRVPAPVPDPGTTPVIRPPGAPGDTVQPK